MPWCCHGDTVTIIISIGSYDGWSFRHHQLKTLYVFSVSNHRHLDYLFSLFGHWTKKTPRFCITGSLSGESTGPLRWRHNERDCVSNHQPHCCLLKRLFGRRSKKTSKLRVTGLCEANSSETGEFPAQRASNAKNVPIWWRHHAPVDS